MAARCDDKEYARNIADTPRQRRVVDELLSRALVHVGNGRIGTAGLAFIYWTERLRPLMEERGFRFETLERGGNTYIMTVYPGEA